MQAKDFISILQADFYTGVPDSQLKAFCDYLMNQYGKDPAHHIIAANEGNAAALAAGYHLATGKTPVVYLQNSGEGNILNPVVSLLHRKVYAIPAIFIIGWRGEPGIHDEPQHIYQGEITLRLLDDMGIQFFVVGEETTIEELKNEMIKFRGILSDGGNVAFVIRKGAIFHEEKLQYKNIYSVVREEAIQNIVAVAGEDLIVSTTGKASRELFEIREKNGQSHKHDFLTVGSMGHASSIALGVAIQKKNTRVWCIDGDGAALMHMGSLAVIGTSRPENFIHIVINNEAHETVGGMPTAADEIDLVAIAKACGYLYTASVDTYEKLHIELENVKRKKSLSLLEIKCSLGSRKDLGRPITTAIENKERFMEYLRITKSDILF